MMIRCGIFLSAWRGLCVVWTESAGPLRMDSGPHAQYGMGKFEYARRVRQPTNSECLQEIAAEKTSRRDPGKTSFPIVP